VDLLITVQVELRSREHALVQLDILVLDVQLVMQRMVTRQALVELASFDVQFLQEVGLH